MNHKPDWLQVALVIFVVFALGNTSFGWQANAVEDRAETLSKSARALHVKSFEKIWKTIRDTHWDSELVGESWEKHRAELLPKVKAAKSGKEARQIMQELIGRLEQSHFGLISKSSYEVIGGEEVKGGTNDIGITIRLVEGGLAVTQVREGGPADQAGVKPGWQVTKIRDRDSAELIEKLREAAHGPQRVETLVGITTSGMTSGNGSKRVEMTFVDGQAQTRVIEMRCAEPPGTMATLGNLPPMRVSDKTMTVDGNIGYYWFNAFLDPVRIMPAYRKAIRDKKHSGGIIIDLRNNFGGIAGMTMGMAGEFVKKPTQMGTMITKGTKLKFFANPRAKPIRVPVAVLIDECSISSAEFLAGGLQDNGLGRVFGQRSAGLALPSVVEKLPNGDGFQYAIADYKSASGEALEMKGVVPDEKIELRRADLLRDKDPTMKAALQWIKQQNAG